MSEKIMRAHYIQHVPFEDLGCIETWLNKNNYRISVTMMFENIIFPDVNNIDFLIIMGGPMSVNDEDKYEWIKQEKEFVERYITTEKALLGICLGAQMIASVLGANIYRNKHKEIGWHPVYGEVINQTVFHWHGETFDIPKGATLIAESEGCKNQGFKYNETVYGLQFHPEVMTKNVSNLIANCGDELLEEGKYIQSKEEIIQLTQQEYEAANKSMENLLNKIIM